MEGARAKSLPYDTAGNTCDHVVTAGCTAGLHCVLQAAGASCCGAAGEAAVAAGEVAAGGGGGGGSGAPPPCADLTA